MAKVGRVLEQPRRLGAEVVRVQANHGSARRQQRATLVAGLARAPHGRPGHFEGLARRPRCVSAGPRRLWICWPKKSRATVGQLFFRF